MAKLISDSEKKILYTKIYHELGAPVVKVEILDEQLDTLFCNSLSDYSEQINNWLIDQQWSSISGLDIEEADFTTAFSTKNLDFVKSFTYAYSKQKGFGTNAPAYDNWELKRDFIVLSSCTQTYIIPKNREVNEILWFTPSFNVYDGLNPINMVAQDFGWSYGSSGALAGVVQPAYSTMLASADRAMKSKLIKSDMSYRITGRADGTKLLYLYPVPGGIYYPTGLGYNSFNQNVNGMYVWYFYYETNSQNKKKCLKENGDIAVVTRPSDAPIDSLGWDKLNSPAKSWVRRMLLAKSKTLLGTIRGKYQGNLPVTDAPITMDYSYLITEGKEEKDALITELKDRLNLLRYVNQLTDRATEAEMINKILGYVPNGIIVM